MTKPRELFASASALEPLLPMDWNGELKELAADLLRKSAQLGGALHRVTRESIIDLLRAMNSYYSNLIEGHNTHPVDIEKALRRDYSSDPANRALQIESQAHIEVQMLVEQRLEENPATEICTEDFICWIHEEFYKRLPDEFRRVKTISGGEDQVLPGKLRSCQVKVGSHIAPTFESLPQFLTRFAEGYNPTKLGPLERIIAAAASHHRLAWIHPFLDGNGRVIRLFTHAYLIKVKIEGHRLWMVSRGLARRREDYMAALASADLTRQGDLDGRGNLSDKGLAHFCKFFLSTAVDQVHFMTELLDLDSMQERILGFAELQLSRTERAAGKKEIPRLLRDVFLRGEISRGEAALILQQPERSARRIIKSLLDQGLLVSNGVGAPVRLGFPVEHVGYYFPRLYPEGAELGKPSVI